MVALLRLLLLLQPGVELLLVEEGGAVDALEHRVAMIAAPVRSTGAEQLDDADLSRRGTVRAEAEVHPVTVPVEGQGPGALGDDVLDDLDLELLALGLKEVDGVGDVHLLADEGDVLGDLLVGLVLDRLELLGGERPVAEEVVVEAALDRRADGDLGPREELLHGARHHVRGIVTDGVQRLGRPRGEDLQLPVLGERPAEVDRVAIEAREDGGLGQARADRLLHEVADADAGRRGLGAAVREGDLDGVRHERPNTYGIHPVRATRLSTSGTT